MFDLKKDPQENHNLASAKSDLVEELSGLLEGWYPVSERQVGKVSPAAVKAPGKPANKAKAK